MQIIDGKKVAEEIKKKLLLEIGELKNKEKTPKLAAIIVGNDFASQKYVNSKEKACKELGIESVTYALKENSSEEEVIELIETLNNDESVDGILLQLPLPKHLDANKIVNKILPEKDADGFSSLNIGKVLKGENTIKPCTPHGVIKLIEYYNIETTGKLCTVIGRSNVVGKPMSVLMLEKDATVIMAHSKTKDLKNILKQSDIIISAVGHTNFITEDMIKENAVVIDIGINRDETGKVRGDVDFENCSKKASYITPVPGGVGPMTIVMLMQNCVELAKKKVYK